MSNQVQDNTFQGESCEGLLKDIFASYSNENIQEALDRLMCSLVKDESFAEENPIARENGVFFIQSLKRHFNRANVINQRSEGGQDGTN